MKIHCIKCVLTAASHWNQWFWCPLSGRGLLQGEEGSWHTWYFHPAVTGLPTQDQIQTNISLQLFCYYFRTGLFLQPSQLLRSLQRFLCVFFKSGLSWNALLQRDGCEHMWNTVEIGGEMCIGSLRFSFSAFSLSGEQLFTYAQHPKVNIQLKHELVWINCYNHIILKVPFAAVV